MSNTKRALLLTLASLLLPMKVAGQNGTDPQSKILGPIANGVQPAPIVSVDGSAFNFNLNIKETIAGKFEVVEAPEFPGLPPVKGNITVTANLVEDPQLPAIPVLPINGTAVRRRLKTLRRRDTNPLPVFVSATVYDHSRTLLRWWPDGKGRGEFEAWSNLDFNHFSGFSDYQVKGSDGVVRTYALLLGLGNEDTASPPGRPTRQGRKYPSPDIPELPDLDDAGPAFVVVEGKRSDADALRIVEDMHALYRSQGGEMATSYMAREASYQARFAYLLANPPEPADVEINFWKRTMDAGIGPSVLRGLADPSGDMKLQQQPTITKGALDTWMIDWTGVAGRTYFLQWSLDLQTWTYAPFIEHGDGPKSYGVSSNSPRMFFRLVYTDEPTADPENDDFDGDQVSNWNEVEKNTDPFGNSDDDRDGMPSDWEVRFHLDPKDALDATSDRDDDGIPNLDEFITETNPTDYYNGDFPTITTIRGEQAYAEPEGFSTLVLEFRRAGMLMPNAPLWMEAVSYPGPAFLSLTDDGNGLASRVETKTGPDGRVTVYVKRGANINSVYVNTYAGGEVGFRTSHTNNCPTDIRRIFPLGTLGRSVTDAIDGRIAGKSPATSMPIYSTQDHGTATYVRNTACWAYDLAQPMTCISPWNNHSGPQRAGVAITPRHVLNAAHFDLFVGDIIRFVTQDNTVVTRTITGKAIHPNYNSTTFYPDVAVYTLDSDLPATITPCKLPPSDFEDFLRPSLTWKSPALCLDQEEKAIVADFTRVGVVRRPPGPDEYRAIFGSPTLPQHRSDFHELRIEGDSGNPAFLIINDELALITVWTQSAQGTSLASQITAINAMIAAADTQAGVSIGHQVQTADLSGFTPFSPP